MGYNDLLLIPVGSTNVRITEVSQTQMQLEFDFV